MEVIVGDYILTTEHQASSNGLPVLVGKDGQAYDACGFFPGGLTWNFVAQNADQSNPLVDRFLRSFPDMYYDL